MLRVNRVHTASVAPTTAVVETPGGVVGTASVHWLRVDRNDLWLVEGEEPPFSLPWTERPVIYREFGEDAPPDASGLALIEPDQAPLGSGSIEVDGSPVEVRLFAAPESDLGPGVDWLCGSTRQWPDPGAPLEAFRRRLLMNYGMGDATPKAAPTPLLGTISRHNALRWSLGLDGLGSVSVGAADAIEQALTRRVRDGAVEFAAWVSDPAALSRLEGLLVGRRPGEASIAKAQAALAWLDDQASFIVSVESGAGPVVAIGVTNLSHRPATFSIEWAGSDQPPRPLKVSPYRLERVALERPRDHHGAEILVTGDHGTARVAVGPFALTVRPPGMTITRFVEAWRLESWMRQAPRLAPDEMATRFTIRRDGDRWTLHATARRPKEMNPVSVHDEVFAAANGPSDLVGVESMIFFVGSFRQPDLVLAVAPDGRVREWTGSSLVASVTTRSDKREWVAEVTLPKEITRESIEVGCIRTLAGSRMVWMTPYAALPWRLDPGRIRFDLTGWDALPGESPPDSSPPGD